MGGASRAVFAAQGVFLLGNGFYTVFYPSAANFPGSSLSGTPDGAVQCIGYAFSIDSVSEVAS